VYLGRYLLDRGWSIGDIRTTRGRLLQEERSAGPLQENQIKKKEKKKRALKLRSRRFMINTTDIPVCSVLWWGESCIIIY
jgi:hypothetical protein